MQKIAMKTRKMRNVHICLLVGLIFAPPFVTVSIKLVVFSWKHENQKSVNVDEYERRVLQWK